MLKVGDKFNRLTIIEVVETPNKRWGTPGLKYVCQCDCGEKRTLKSYLVTGGQKSCGCSRRTRISKEEKLPNWKSLTARRRDMIRRCFDPKFKDYHRYGGRNITICLEWLESPSAFYNWAIGSGFQSELCLDRKDNNGPYSPDNCHWTTNQENCLNQEKTIRVKIGDFVYRTKEMKKIFGVCQQLISKWNRNGSLESKLRQRLGERE